MQQSTAELKNRLQKLGDAHEKVKMAILGEDPEMQRVLTNLKIQIEDEIRDVTRRLSKTSV